MSSLTARMHGRHGQYKPLLDPGHADPAGIDVVAGKASQHDTVFVKGEQVAVAVLIRISDSSLTQSLLHLNIKEVTYCVGNELLTMVSCWSQAAPGAGPTCSSLWVYSSLILLSVSFS